jgi:DNA-binding CsgD family transcriptional regulator
MSALLADAAARPDTTREVAAFDGAVRALVPWLAHDLAEADRLLDQGCRPLAEHASAAPIYYWGAWAVLRTSVADDGVPREFLRTAPAGLRDVNRGAVCYADAIAAGRTGQHALAEELFAAGDRELGRHHWWRRLLRLVALEAAVNDGWGDPVGALRADLTVFESDGERLLARTVRDLLRQAGAPTRRGRGESQVPPGLRAFGVTSREMDVLGLVADGLTNAEIAGRLYLSPRTIETHVANLLAKTASTDRAGLRRTFRAQTP